MLDLEHYYDPTLPEPIVSTALALPDPFAPDHIPMRNPPAEGGVDIAGVTVTALKPSSPNPFDYAIFVNAQNSAALLALQDRFVFQRSRC